MEAETKLGFVLYLIGAIMLYFGFEWGYLGIILGMVFHFRFWIPFILGAVGGFLLVRN